MKKLVYFLLFALCLPIGLMAQSTDDDLYFVPSKDKEKKTTPVRNEQNGRATTNIYTSPGSTVVVQNRGGESRSVDEYNRRYDARENEFSMENDTLYIKEKARPDLEGEWVNGEFEGTQSDYDYAERIIRFRNPRFAISVSSPLYWDVVYGANSWDWNVYTDGHYAYAFPTFSNPAWWNWRHGSYGYGWGYGYGWNRPNYAWSYSSGYWGGWHGTYCGGFYGGGGYWGNRHYYSGWGGGGGRDYWANTTYTNRRSYGYRNGSTTTSSRRDGNPSTDRRSAVSINRGSSAGAYRGRTVGTRREGTTSRAGATTRSEGYSSRGEYTRPSSTRRSAITEGTRQESTRSGATYSGSSRRSASSYSTGGSSTESSRSSSSRREATSSSRSSNNSYNNSRASSSSSSRSYTPSSSDSRRSSAGSYSGAGSSRSSGGGGSSSRGGGSRR